jgi:hypothetical protein
MGLGGRVACMASGVESVSENGHGVKMMTTGLKETVQGGGEADGVARPAVGTSISGDGDKGGPFGI